MKHKTIILSLSLSLLGAGAALAGTGVPLTTTGGATFTFKPSNNVGIYYTVDASPAQKYAAASKNTAGNRLYASANDNSNLYFTEITADIGKLVGDCSKISAVASGVFTSSSDWKSQ